MRGENTKEKPQDEGVMLQVTFEGSEDVPIVYASNVFVRHAEDVFLITFAQAHGPYIVNPTVEQLKQMRTVPAKIVSRIAVPPSRMKEILDVLNGNYEQFAKTQQRGV